ncbi:hypothetical protein D9757_008981 [Collybiopsis confluens]|uniref:Uncharacterized protein n=1 Tax=Collybiopsis confluens TaxID=2823264 RepID=A0A8H5H2W3_9AGAR|nr:hypothetical protein D9757_008981 [Collybiopsis confluens]
MKLLHVPLLAASILNLGAYASILINPPAQPALPSVAQAASFGLNLTNIQGDILIGMKKNKELFFFFKIQDATAFKSHLGANILPLITTTTQILSNSPQLTTLVNIAFSQKGLSALGVTDNLGDTLFFSGQLNGSSSFNDQLSNWVPQFAGSDIDGVLLLASDTVDNVDSTLSTIQSSINGSISEVYRIQGAARPGDQQGHEHFGFMDGISNPTISGFAAPALPGTIVHPGQAVVAPGIILVGEQGDPSLSSRPAWALDGSFLAFRQLQQRVPEFNKYLLDNALSEPNFTVQENADLLGARMMGRWKSGAPIDLTPLADDPVLANDPNRNNNFNYTHPTFDIKSDQTHCPFSAHIRKTNPRADLAAGFNNHIIRAGIPYGPEVTSDEASASASSTDPTLERGLAFVAYQSSISTGFAFLQKAWASNANFHTVLHLLIHIIPFLSRLLQLGKWHDHFTGKCARTDCHSSFFFFLCLFKIDYSTGEDPIIGVAAGDGPRHPSGLDPQNSTRVMTIEQDFVVSRGGEYFFSPSLLALQNTLSV